MDSFLDSAHALLASRVKAPAAFAGRRKPSNFWGGVGNEPIAYAVCGKEGTK